MKRVLGVGSTFMLLSHNPLPVAVVISAIDRSRLVTMAVSVSIACLSVRFSSSHCLLGGGCCFFFATGCCCFRFNMASLFFTYHSSLYCFTVSGSWLGMTKVVSVKGVRLIAIVLSDNHSPRSRDGTGEGNLVPIGSTHDVPPDDQTPHLRIRFPPIT